MNELVKSEIKIKSHPKAKKETVEHLPSGEQVFCRQQHLTQEAVTIVREEIPEDWSWFDKIPPDLCFCRCGSQYHSHVILHRNRKQYIKKLFSRLACPNCGSHDNLEGSSNGSLFLIRQMSEEAGSKVWNNTIIAHGVLRDKRKKFEEKVAAAGLDLKKIAKESNDFIEQRRKIKRKIRQKIAKFKEHLNKDETAKAKTAEVRYSKLKQWLFQRIEDARNDWHREYDATRTSDVYTKAYMRQQGQQKLDFLCSNTFEGVIRSQYGHWKTYNALRKSGDENAKPPYREKKYFMLSWDKTCITFENGCILLRTSQNCPVQPAFPCSHSQRVQSVTITFNRQLWCNILTLSYKKETPKKPPGEGIASIDMGERYLFAIYDGETVLLVDGKSLRNKRQYQNKVKAKSAKKLTVDHRKLTKKQKRKGFKPRRKDSRRRVKALQGQRRSLYSVDNQIEDEERKAVATALSHLVERKIGTVFIGALSGIRDSHISKKRAKKEARPRDYKGSVQNQRMNQFPAGKLTQMLRIKCNEHGIVLNVVEESYTSKTCPKCGTINNPGKNNYVCKKCKHSGHRDAVGAINIMVRGIGKHGSLHPIIQGRKFNPQRKCYAF